MSIPPRFPITREQIARVVSEFYRRIRQHPDLGPIFFAHVEDWPKHEAKITGFWANAILHERAYDGNPMQKHLHAGNVRPDHFADWLSLFDEVLRNEVPAETAERWSALAHRIGKGLHFGLTEYVRPAKTAPQF